MGGWKIGINHYWSFILWPEDNPWELWSTYNSTYNSLIFQKCSSFCICIRCCFVSQLREHQPSASSLIDLWLQTLHFFKVCFQQEKMRSENMPPMLIQRLVTLAQFIMNRSFHILMLQFHLSPSLLKGSILCQLSFVCPSLFNLSSSSPLRAIFPLLFWVVKWIAKFKGCHKQASAPWKEHNFFSHNLMLSLFNFCWAQLYGQFFRSWSHPF